MNRLKPVGALVGFRGDQYLLEPVEEVQEFPGFSVIEAQLFGELRV